MLTFDFTSLRHSAHGGLEGTIRFAKFDRDVSLMIECDAIESLTAVQRKAIAQFLEWDAPLFHALETPIFRYYRDFLEMTGLQEPRIEAPEAVWGYLEPLGVIVPDYVNGDHTYIQVELNCDWEVEHGMEWDIRNAKDILYVGPFEGNCFEMLEEDGPRGYVLGEW